MWLSPEMEPRPSKEVVRLLGSDDCCEVYSGDRMLAWGACSKGIGVGVVVEA